MLAANDLGIYVGKGLYILECAGGNIIVNGLVEGGK